MSVVKNPLLRHTLFAVGIASLILGAIGVFLPVLPTTPFILLAAWCFLRSSPKAHEWLYKHRLLGPLLKDWEQHRAIRRPVKVLAISMIALSLAIIWIKVQNSAVQIGVTILLVAVSTFIVTRNEKS